ncbi:uncharacterized protein [Drosophila virilis]|uniref:Uncharacterized protein n=1 Tax=Drosophila virilis TaxID=7244 RepID=B4M3G6_DROVI|nr:uncharacterized protein Dvir_GJ19209 [Drosophila virilis]
MASTWICFGLALLLCLCICTWAAPPADDSRQFDELERTLKELATSLLAMSGNVASGGTVGTAEGSTGDLETNLIGSEAATALEYLNELPL